MQGHDSNEWRHFERAVRALAQPPDVQLTLFPAFVNVPDELALEFDDSLRVLSPTEFGALARDAAELIRILDGTLAAMSGPAHQELWTEEALRTDPHWEKIRRLALALIRSMGWSAEPPPDDRANHVSG